MRIRPFLSLSLLFLAPAVAQAADVASPLVIGAPAVAADTACSKPSVLARIKQRFAYAERTNWHRGFTIASIDNARPGHHPYAEPGIIERDYCIADTTMTNGGVYQVFYAVEHGVGFVGIGSYVDFCVLGLDPWHVHDGDCRTVR